MDDFVMSQILLAGEAGFDQFVFDPIHFVRAVLGAVEGSGDHGFFSAFGVTEFTAFRFRAKFQCARIFGVRAGDF